MNTLKISKCKNFRQWKFDRPAPGTVNKDVRRERYPWPTTDGPWNREPDKIQWIDPTTGLDCLMVRNPAGAWCGYVGVQPDHPYYAIEYGHCAVKCETDGRTMGDLELPDSVPLPDSMKEMEVGCDDYQHYPSSHVDVHGSLTFSGFCQPGEPIEGICHVAAEGREAKVWWLGFDCGHSFDYLPRMAEWEEQMSKADPIFKKDPLFTGTYRDVDFVIDEVTRLAKQLAAITEVPR